MKRSVKLFVIACAVVAAAAGGGAFLVGGSSSKDAHAGVFSGHFYWSDSSMKPTRYHWVWGLYSGSTTGGGNAWTPKRCGFTTTQPTASNTFKAGSNTVAEPYYNNGAWADNSTGSGGRRQGLSKGIATYHYLDSASLKYYDCTDVSGALATDPSSTSGAPFTLSSYQTP